MTFERYKVNLRSSLTHLPERYVCTHFAKMRLTIIITPCNFFLFNFRSRKCKFTLLVACFTRRWDTLQKVWIWNHVYSPRGGHVLEKLAWAFYRGASVSGRNHPVDGEYDIPVGDEATQETRSSFQDRLSAGQPVGYAETTSGASVCVRVLSRHEKFNKPHRSRAFLRMNKNSCRSCEMGEKWRYN